jgi:hypothetical protein
MNASRGYLEYFWLLAIMPAALAQSRAEIVTDNDLKVALHDVLSHNNLFDAAYLSDRLDIGLHIGRPEAVDRDTTRFAGTATASPPALYGWFTYEADVDRARQTSTVRVYFVAKSCAPLQQWGSEWHIQTHWSMATDGGPSSESLVWPGNEGITLTVTTSDMGCSVGMSQTLKRVVGVPVSPELPHAPASGLSRQIADLLLSDLRDYARVGRILNTEFVVESDSQRKGFLYRGRPFPGRVIPGFKSDIDYDGDDSGWYMPPGFIARPLHITDRSVTLNLTADSDVVCLSQTQLASELEQRDRRIRKLRGDSRDESVYSVRGVNLVSVAVTFAGKCATMLHFHQVTDVARSLGDPMRFTPGDSLDRSKSDLTDDAQRRINLLSFRLRSVSIAGIEIEQMPGKHPTVAVNQDLALLKRLISKALKRKGVAAPSRSANDETGACHLRLQPGAPTVCVDVWL